jgi:CRP-like cAMP-binding protein
LSQSSILASNQLRIYGAFGWKLNAAAERLAKIRSDVMKYVHPDLDLIYTPNLTRFFERKNHKFKYKAGRVLSKGDSFGELALINRKPRSATVVCIDDCYLASLSTKHYLETLKEVEKH